MARQSTINVSLTPQQLQMVHQRVRQGGYSSASELIREALRMLFGQNGSPSGKSRQSLKTQLAAGYKVTARHDRRTAQECDKLMGRV